MTLEIAARGVRCDRTRWESTATVRLRYATADLGHAVLSAPVAVTAHPVPFTSSPADTVDESVLPRIVAGLRNLAISVFRQNGETNIAAALRRTSRDYHRPLSTLGLT